MLVLSESCIPCSESVYTERGSWHVRLPCKVSIYKGLTAEQFVIFSLHDFRPIDLSFKSSHLLNIYARFFVTVILQCQKGGCYDKPKMSHGGKILCLSIKNQGLGFQFKKEIWLIYLALKKVGVLVQLKIFCDFTQGY